MVAASTSWAGPISEGPAKLIAADVRATEGPAWDPASGCLYFVGHPDHISRLDPDGRIEVWRTPAGGPGGALIDPQGRLVVCESKARRMTRYGRDGSVTVLAERYEGMRFNSPNDVALDSRGRIYFTDPRYGDRSSMEMRDAQGRLVDGVYRIDAPGRVTRILTHEVQRPNGILVSPDDRRLYIADNNADTPGGARLLVSFDLRPDGTVAPGSRRIIFDWKGGRAADGFKLDREGRFYVAAGTNTPSRYETTEFKSGIYILSPEGKLIEFVPIGTTAQNCAFGGKDLRTLYVTAAGTLWSVRMKAAGRVSSER